MRAHSLLFRKQAQMLIPVSALPESEGADSRRLLSGQKSGKAAHKLLSTARPM